MVLEKIAVFRMVFHTCLATSLLVIPLAVWRWLFGITDWAVVPLSVLMALLFFGFMPIGAAVYKARLGAALRSDATIAKVLTGKLKAYFESAVFAVVAVVVLSWQALTISAGELGAVVALSLAVGLGFSFFKILARTQFQEPFTTFLAFSSATWIIGGMFVPLVAWVNWNYVSYPVELRNIDLPQAILLGLQELPRRGGWVSEVLSPLFAYDAIKLWIVLQLGASRLATIIFSIDTALVSFIVARCIVTLTLLSQVYDVEIKHD
jgi:hypothetical protein